MTDKERLQEIAYNVGVSLDGEKAIMSSDDYDFLYNYALQQTERVRELEELEQEYADLNSDFTKLVLENKRYREALEFIGNHANESELMNNTMYTKLVKEIIEKALEESK